MKKKGGILKNLSLIGCIAALILLVIPAASAEVFIPAPYTIGAFPVQNPVNGESITGLPGLLVSPAAVSSYIPLAPAAGIIDFPTGTLYPGNSAIINPAIIGTGTAQQTFGAYYTGSGASTSGFRNAGARYMCSL